VLNRVYSLITAYTQIDTDEHSDTVAFLVLLLFLHSLHPNKSTAATRAVPTPEYSSCSSELIKSWALFLSSRCSN